jgi:hypothetical protein
MSNNRGTRRNPRYSGRVGYKGHKKWVGTYPTADEYNKAAEAARKELREEVDGEKAKKNEVPTVLEFAGATIHENGRITMTWPDGQRAQKETGRRDRTVSRMREALKPFIREFGERRLDSFTRDEALTWALPKGANTQQAARQLFNHAKDRDLIKQNHFSRLGASKRKRRVDRPDFEIVTDEQYEELLHCARASRADEFGLIIEGAILAVGEAALRPGEVFAFHRDEVDWEHNELPVRWQLDPRNREADLAQGRRSAPRADEPEAQRAPAEDADAGQDPVPRRPRRLHERPQLVQALARGPGLSRDAGPGVLRAEAPCDPVDGRSGGGRRAGTRPQDRGGDRRPRGRRLPDLHRLHEAEREAGTRTGPAGDGRAREATQGRKAAALRGRRRVGTEGDGGAGWLSSGGCTFWCS